MRKLQSSSSSRAILPCFPLDASVGSWHLLSRFFFIRSAARSISRPAGSEVVPLDGWRLAMKGSRMAAANSRATIRIAGGQRNSRTLAEARNRQMRDVIVIGAGGGGPAVAKELAARGLDILIL